MHLTQPEHSPRGQEAASSRPPLQLEDWAILVMGAICSALSLVVGLMAVLR